MEKKKLFTILMVVIILGVGFLIFKDQIISKLIPTETIPAKVFKVGVLQFVAVKPTDDYVNGALSAITEAGFVQGKDVIYFIDKSPNGDRQKASEALQKLIDRNVDLLLVTNTVGTQEAVKLTDTIPIVFLGVADPLNTGLVKSLAGSGTNIAGATAFPPVDKTFEYTKGILPDVKKIGIIYATTDAAAVALANRASDASKKLNIELVESPVTARDQVVGAAQELLNKKVDALYIPPDTVVVPAAKAVQKLAAVQGIPLIGNVSKDTSLLNLNVNFLETGEIGGKIVVKIFKGANPGLIPMGNPNRFFLTLNLKVAKELGITIPENILALANEIITEEGAIKEITVPE